MLTSAKRNWKVKYYSLLACGTGNYLINVVVWATTIVKEVLIWLIPWHASQELTLVVLGLYVRLGDNDIVILIGDCDVNVVTTTVIEGKLSHVTLHISPWVALEEEWIGKILLHLHVDLMLVWSLTLCIVENWLWNVPDHILFWYIDVDVFERGCHTVQHLKLNHIRCIVVSRVDWIHAREELGYEDGHLGI